MRGTFWRTGRVTRWQGERRCDARPSEDDRGQQDSEALEVGHKGLHIVECAPGVSHDDIRAATETKIV